MAKEGIKLLSVFFLVGIFFILSPFKWVSIPFFLSGIFVIYFFRDPNREVPDNEGCIVSPADGRVIGVEEIPGENLKKISIFMSLFNVHINRIPYTGSVKKITYKRGRFRPANSLLSFENEQNIVDVETEAGWNYRVVQVAGILARRIVCRIKEKDIVKTGDRFGLIMFGSRVDLYIPKDFPIFVKKGDRVKGSESIIGRTK